MLVLVHWYALFNILLVPESVFTNEDKAIWDFIWDGKTDNVKRDMCRSAEYLKHIMWPEILFFWIWVLITKQV